MSSPSHHFHYLKIPFCQIKKEIIFLRSICPKKETFHPVYNVLKVIVADKIAKSKTTLQPSQVKAPKWKPEDGALHTLQGISPTFSFLTSLPVKEKKITF